MAPAAAATTKNILIFGATGTVGTHIAAAILRNKASFGGKIGIFTSENTIWTKSEEIDQLKAMGADEVIAGSVKSDSDVAEAYSGYDTVVSCMGRPVIQHQLKLIELAEKHPDVKRFIPSEYGTDIEYGPKSANEKPHQQKLKVRALLKTCKDLEYTYVVTGPYGDASNSLYLDTQPVAKEKNGTFDVRRKKAVLLGDGNGKISLTTMRDVGKLVVAALLHPEEAKNRALKVNSFTTTPKEIAAEFERQTGGEPWTVGYTSLDELRKLEQDAWEQNLPYAGGLTLRRIWTEGGTLYESRDNAVIGMEEGLDTLESAVKQAIEVQTRDTFLPLN